MDSSSDDDIELLKQIPGEESVENSDFGGHNFDSNINPFDLVKRGSSPGDLIDPASVHALQYAFTALRHKHNEEVRKNKELIRENKAVKKAYMDATQGNQGQYQNMEEYINDSSVVHAAGGTSEDESLAESRAKQGFCHQLQREILIANNTIQRGNEEIYRLKMAKEELEREMTKNLNKIDELQSRMEVVEDSLNKAKEENARKDLEIAQMKNAVQSEQELNHNFRIKIESLQEQIQANQRNGLTGQNEIVILKNKLDSAEKELKKVVMQYQELNQRFQESENKVGILEAKCKQYEIEVNINRKQRHEKVEDFDDVDGDVMMLERALGLLSSQREEVIDLKKKIAEQQQIIAYIQTTGKRFPGKSMDSSLFRPEVQGSSYIQPYEEHAVYVNYPNSGVQQGLQTAHAPLSRRSSDRGDYRGIDKAPRTSPRINENILPTGNQNVTPMLAMESNHLPKRMEIANTVDSSVRTKSPGENLPDSSRYSNNPRSSSQENLLQRTPVAGNQYAYGQQSPRNIPSQAKVGNVIENTHFVESPISRENLASPNNADSQSHFRTNTQDVAFIQNGARPRVPTSSSSYLNQYSNQEPLNQYSNQEPASPRQKPQFQQLPDRMTKSEIFVRDKQGDNPMTRSVLDPLQPLEIPASSNTRQNEYVYSETGGAAQQTPNEHTYQNQFQVRDYENVYNTPTQTERNRRAEEHEDAVFLTCNSPDNKNVQVSQPVQEETGEGNVAAVKVCPVCNEEFSRLTLDQFQMHVFECFDNCDESPATLQPSAGGNSGDDDRTCPMCGDSFPLTIPQETYEQHVLAHFGEDPLVERFEMLQP